MPSHAHRDTTKAEYMARSLTVRQASWYIIGLQELGLKVPVTLKCDNTSTIDLSHHSIISQCSKPIDIHYHFVWECLINKKFSIEYIESSSNPTDTFTKALDALKFTQFTQQFGCTVWERVLEYVHPPHPSFCWVIFESYLLPAIFLHTYWQLKCFYFCRLSCHFSSYFITLDYYLTCIYFRLSIQLKLQIFSYFLPI